MIPAVAHGIANTLSTLVCSGISPRFAFSTIATASVNAAFTSSTLVSSSLAAKAINSKHSLRKRFAPESTVHLKASEMRL